VSAAEAAEAIRPPRRFANKTEFRLLVLGMTSEGDAMSARLLSGLLAASHVRLPSMRRRPRASKIAPVLESGFHRLTLVFGLASVAIWTYPREPHAASQTACAGSIPAGASRLPCEMRRMSRHFRACASARRAEQPSTVPG
jgi:hypothetical protein